MFGWFGCVCVIFNFVCGVGIVIVSLLRFILAGFDLIDYFNSVVY